MPPPRALAGDVSPSAGRGHLARTLACALVVLVHVNIYVRGGLGAWWPFGLDGAAAYGASVPAFFVLSGYAAPWPVQGQPLAPRLGRLLVPFVLWNGVMLALGAEGEAPTGLDIAWTLGTGSWHLYYLFVLGQLLVVDRLVHRLRPGLAPGLLLAGAAVLAVAAHGLSDALLWTRPGDGGDFEAEARKALPFWGVYFFAGAALRRGAFSLDDLAARWPWLLALAAATMPLYTAHLRAQDEHFGYVPRLQLGLATVPFQFFGGLLLVGGARRLELGRRARRFVAALQAVAPDTFGIYLAHNAVLLVVHPMLQRAGLTSPQHVEALGLGALVFALGWALVRLARRFAPPAVGAALFGVRP